MRATTDAITPASAVAHVRAKRATATAPKPIAIAGARVARAGRDRVQERVTRAALVDAYVEPGISFAPNAFSVVVDAGETIVEPGCVLFDRALEIARRCDPDSYDASTAEHVAAMLVAVEDHARRKLASDVDAAIIQANRALRDTVEFALDLIDEAPVERRASMAARARAALAATVDEKRPALVLVARTMITVRSVARVARWRLSSEAGWTMLETETRSDSTRLHARCPHCCERSTTWALCDQCVEARCGRCARRCARCRRVGCVRCSRTTRCGACGLAAMELVDES
jgi:hypothetical protein